jgi:hypothetical protein
MLLPDRDRVMTDAYESKSYSTKRWQLKLGGVSLANCYL